MEQEPAAKKKEAEKQIARNIRDGVRYLEMQLEPEVDNLMTEVALSRREIADECVRLWKRTYENRLSKILNQSIGRQTSAATINYQRRVSGLMKTSKFPNDEVDPPAYSPNISEATDELDDLKAKASSAKHTLQFLERLNDDV